MDFTGNEHRNSHLFAKLQDCDGCKARKEYVKTMLTDSRFWVGVVVGVAGTWAWHKYAKKG